MEVEAFKKVKQITEKNLEELGKKSDLNPSEMKTFKEALELIDYLDGKIQQCEMKENGYSQYSGHGEMYATPRRYSIVSYGTPQGGMSYNDYGPMMGSAYCDPMYYGDSMRNGRSYTMGPNMDRAYYGDMRGNSRHSINDRAVACLEKEMDGAKSEYEKQQLHRFIEMIRSAE